VIILTATAQGAAGAAIDLSRRSALAGRHGIVEHDLGNVRNRYCARIRNPPGAASTTGCDSSRITAASQSVRRWFAESE